MSFFYINQILWAVQYFLMEFHSQKEHEVQLEKVFSKQLSGGSSSLQTSQLQWSSQKHVNAPSIVLIGHPLDGLGGFNKLFTTCPVILHLLKWFMKKCFVLNYEICNNKKSFCKLPVIFSVSPFEVSASFLFESSSKPKMKPWNLLDEISALFSYNTYDDVKTSGIPLITTILLAILPKKSSQYLWPWISTEAFPQP